MSSRLRKIYDEEIKISLQEKMKYKSSMEIIEAFDKGKHQIVFVVDILNEGIDIPDVECILLLRPTQSETILTQQLGRGLRISHGKSQLDVLDFIGNYKTSPMILKTLGFSNFNGGFLAKHSNISIHSKIYNYGIGEDINHILMHLLMQFIAKSNLNTKKKKIIL